MENKNKWKILTIIVGFVAIILLGFAAYSTYNYFKQSEADKVKAEQQNKYAEDAVTQLQKLNAATDIGINKPDYSKMLIQALPVVNQAISKMLDDELKQEIRLSMDAFRDAKTLWDIMGDDGYFLACEKQPDTKQNDSKKELLEFMCNPEGGELKRKYRIPLRPYRYQQAVIDGQGTVIKEEGLSIIWKSAKEHLNRASSLYKS